jgi:protein arginine N-methyltransferase 1
MDQRNLLMHQVMLSDRVRLDAYDKAIAATVGPGAVVADVGAGTLALTALALRHGAAHVHALEADPDLVPVAAAIIEANGWTDRVTLYAGDAARAELPGKVDVIVAELIGNLGPEEDMTRLLSAVAKRWLRRGGRIVPERLVSRVVPIEFDDEGWGVWRPGLLDMDLSVVQQYVRPQPQLHFFRNPPTVLASPAVLSDSAAGGQVHRSLRLHVERPGRLHALAGYFTATLSPGVELTNFPSYPGCNWAVPVWPVRHTAVDVGDALAVRLRAPQDSRIVTDWTVDCALVRAA